MYFFSKPLLDVSARIPPAEIVYVCATALFIAFLAALASKNKWFFKLSKLFKLTNKFGELDVWGYTMNLETDEAAWVTVRDHRNDLVFDGWLHAFSDDSQTAELLLRDVSVYENESGEPLYQVGAMYVSRKREDITIELRNFKIDENIKWKETTDAEHQKKCDQGQADNQ